MKTKSEICATLNDSDQYDGKSYKGTNCDSELKRDALKYLTCRKEKETNMKTVLIETDGYSIDTTEFDTKDNAIIAMKKRYADLTPNDNNESFADMSYITDTNAILYQNGENVYVWKIITV